MRFNGQRQTNYEVKSGDTLYKIAKKYDVPLSDLYSENGLTNSKIYPNQILLIPQKQPNGTIYFKEYMVEPNDTLATLAAKHNITIEKLGEYNDLGKLVLGEIQEIKVPYQYETYKVKNGDTLESILNKSNMNLKEFLEVNYKFLLPVGTTIYIKQQ